LGMTWLYPAGKLQSYTGVWKEYWKATVGTAAYNGFGSCTFLSTAYI
jgi:hypothetical protein